MFDADKRNAVSQNAVPQAGEESERLILARLGEVALKGLNRSRFEKRILNALNRRLGRLGRFSCEQKDSRIWIHARDAQARQALEEALRVTCTVFGLVSASPARRYSRYATLDDLRAAAVDYVRREVQVGGALRFKVESRRGDKRYPYRSPEICAEVGDAILAANPAFVVDVHKPELLLQMEVRDAVYIYHTKQEGARGLPIGSSSRGMLLLSGGIDSPVAAYMMAGRGMELEAIYFHAFPFTSDQAKEKVLELGRILCDYLGRLKLHVVDFTETQLLLRDRCPSEMMTIVMRRMMMREADALATRRRCLALVTGESLGQVASQTTEAISCSQAVVTRPVFRPLIGIDKDETIRKARRIGTFETSILPYEDCCTVFVPRHPRTRPALHLAEEAELRLGDIQAIVDRDLERITTYALPDADKTEHEPL